MAEDEMVGFALEEYEKSLIPDPPHPESYKKFLRGNPFGDGLDSVIREYMAGKNDPERFRELYEREPLSMRETIAKVKEWYPDDYIEIGKRFTKALLVPDPLQLERDLRIRESTAMQDIGTREPLAHGVNFDERLGDIRPRKKFPTFNEAVLATFAWVDYLHANAQLLLSGGTGVGKTMLGKIAATLLMGRGANIVYRTEAQLISEIRASFNTHDTDALIEQYGNTEWLIIDELGVSSLTPAFAAIYDQLIDIRWQRAGEVRTMYTTNLVSAEAAKEFAKAAFARGERPEKLPILPARMESRVADIHRGVSVQIDASDYRTDRNA